MIKRYLLLGIFLCGAAAVEAQTYQNDNLTFVRIKYSSGKFSYGFRLRFQLWDSWEVDYPTAEENFLRGLKEITRVPINEQALAVRLTDPQLFNYAFAYMLEVGFMQLSPGEADSLGEWCLRGGFLMIDDFHGSAQWENFSEEFSRVFPGRQPVELKPDHPIFHCYFDFDRYPQVPGLAAIYRNSTYEYDGRYPHCRGLFDDNGRLMVLINFNVDLGDSWEHAADPRYPEYYSMMGYRLGVNYVIYALTH
ncbi:MAG: DUF4159 domain-containing protein [candidate division KSB1 bacterium]